LWQIVSRKSLSTVANCVKLCRVKVFQPWQIVSNCVA
jgi:hypothetical protein